MLNNEVIKIIGTGLITIVLYECVRFCIPKYIQYRNKKKAKDLIEILTIIKKEISTRKEITHE